MSASPSPASTNIVQHPSPTLESKEPRVEEEPRVEVEGSDLEALEDRMRKENETRLEKKIRRRNRRDLQGS